MESAVIVEQGDFLDFFFYVLFTTLHHLPPSDYSVSVDAGIDPGLLLLYFRTRSQTL
jgi:hypothetical protein